MALRIITPLDEEDWNKLVAGLEKGQTKEQAAIVEEAIKHANTLSMLSKINCLNLKLILIK